MKKLDVLFFALSLFAIPFLGLGSQDLAIDSSNIDNQTFKLFDLQTIAGVKTDTLELGADYKVVVEGTTPDELIFAFVNNIRVDTLKSVLNFGYYFTLNNIDLDTKEAVTTILREELRKSDKIELILGHNSTDYYLKQVVTLEGKPVRYEVAYWLLIFAIVAVAFITLWTLRKNKSQILRDAGTGIALPPFSLARSQMAFWTVIILISILWVWYDKGYLVSVTSQVLMLLGISAGTTVTANLIDNADLTNAKIKSRHQDSNSSQSFFLNIVSDQKGLSIHRFQNVIFSLSIGLYFLYEVIKNNRIPELDENLMVLMGISSGTYLAIKKGENTAYQVEDAEKIAKKVASDETEKSEK